MLNGATQRGQDSFSLLQILLVPALVLLCLSDVFLQGQNGQLIGVLNVAG